MAQYNLICDSPDHASRSEEPDYIDPLGTVEVEVEPLNSGMLCPACQRLDHDENLGHVKEEKISAIDAKTEQLIYQGFEFPPGSGHIFSASPEMQRTLLGTYIAKDHPAMSYPIIWSTSNDGANISLENASDVESFYLTGLGTIRAYKDTGTALKDQVRAATTIAEVQAIADNR